jgi:hypothetical protein
MNPFLLLFDFKVIMNIILILDISFYIYNMTKNIKCDLTGNFNLIHMSQTSKIVRFFISIKNRYHKTLV